MVLLTMKFVIKRKNIIYPISCLIATIVVFHFSSSVLSVDYNQNKTILLQLYVIPKHDLSVNFTLEIPRVNITEPEIQAFYYNITKRPDPSVKQIVSINFHLPCNKTKPLNLLITELEPVEGWSSYHHIYYDLAENATTNRIVKTYFSAFIAVYTVKVKWLGGFSEIPIFRDAYHYGVGTNGENHYTTERLSLLITILSVLLSLVVLGIGFSLHPSFRSMSLGFYPWLTIFLVGATVLLFIFWTPAESTVSLGFFSMFLSYFLHFDSGHLIGNLKNGIITLLLLESWIGTNLKKGTEIRVKVVVAIIVSKILFWTIGMAGFGASFVNEVLGVLLIMYIIAYRTKLTGTRFRLFIFPIFCFFAGYALLRYVIDWAVAGYVYKISIESAELHIRAFLWGILLSLISFLTSAEVRANLKRFMRRCYTILRSIALREENKRSLALVLAGALFGVLVPILNLPPNLGIWLATLLLIAIAFLLLYGVGIPQAKYRELILRQRWKEPLKIGILNDMKWDVNNKEIYSWSDIPPNDWKNVIERFVKKRKVSAEVELINVGMNFDSYTAILNPYGGVYPELDLRNLLTLEKIVNYVRDGGLFINVADIPSYWAYSPDLHRKLDITSPIYAISATPTGLQIVSTKPYELTPLMKKLGLRVAGFPMGIRQNLRPVITTKISPMTKSERLAIVESNVTSCIPTSKQLYTDGNKYNMSALFFVKYGEGDFLFSLIWVNTTYHNQQAKEAIRDAICKLTIDKLSSKITK